MPWEYVRWTLAERTGWTLEYIDALPVDTVYQALSVWGYVNEARAHNAKYRR